MPHRVIRSFKLRRTGLDLARMRPFYTSIHGSTCFVMIYKKKKGKKKKIVRGNNSISSDPFFFFFLVGCATMRSKLHCKLKLFFITCARIYNIVFFENIYLPDEYPGYEM